MNALTDGLTQLKNTLSATGPTKMEVEVPTRPSFKLPQPRTFLAKLGLAYEELEKRASPTVLLGCEAMQLVYTGFTVPFRIGFMYNPYFTSMPSPRPEFPEVVMYLLLALDILFDLIALVAALRILKTPGAVNAVVPIDQSEPSFSVKATHHRNSEFQQSLLKGLRRYQIIAEWLALLPFDLVFIGQPNAMILCRIPKLLRMYKVPEITRLVKQAFAEHELLSGFHNVGMSLLAGVLLLSLALIHWATCLFLLVAHLECGFYLDQTVSGQTCWAN
ncbi:hypothetical protein H310_04899 [Aphanomyces invadans]|uniref:Ion transport domain-containing protein n=1 Tax=Aphanomyces invadans TaxID=157072 RepID=A0A024UB89_9STRA|nr:hypothetical protein H310_04899 [Aphanomyces invadans]ETW03435.1 hypothetical protein H310_04899 [Aphanomyces invadans]|eukprot:XP_008867664.1 hypothetical protein H310_04899 [Aphanomyces invadans]